jgi:phage recombination protein Bet
MTNALHKYETTDQEIAKKLQLWTDSYMKDASSEEVGHFHNICLRTGLSPEMKQIYPVPRYSSQLKRQVWTFQVSIDGFRLIAERTGRYAPGRQSDYTYNDKNELLSATSYVKKRTDDGTWHEVAHTAFYKEYVQLTKDGKPTQFWQNMEHVMLSKCAESCALRKAFPADLSGLYTTEEMSQAQKEEEKPKNAPISESQVQEIEGFLKSRDELKEKLFKWAQINHVSDLTSEKYAPAMKAIELHLSKESE